MKRIVYAVIAVLITFINSYSQEFPKFSIAGGPILGWSVPSVTDLNAELKKMGISEFKTSGFFTSGGAGFIDVPVVKGLRAGGYGIGYSDYTNSEYTNTIRSARISYNSAGIMLDYVRKISNTFDYTIGASIGLGTFRMDITQHSKDLNNWNPGVIISDSVSSNIFSYSKSLVTLQPQAGIGFYPLSFLYFKLNAGYTFTVSGDWKLNDVVKVNNIPAGIKADGFHFSLGIYAGLFVK